MATLENTLRDSRPDPVVAPRQSFTVTATASDTLDPPQIPDAALFVSAAGKVTLNTTTAVNDGRIPGQRLTLHCTAGIVVLPDGANTSLGGAVTLYPGESLDLVWDPTGSAWRSYHRPMGGGKVVFFDDFLGDLLKDELIATAGSGTGNAVALVAGSVGGAVEIKTASDDGAITANGSSLCLGALSFKANQGGLRMKTRLQIDAITDVMLFVGFTDVLGSTLEEPIFLTAADIDSTATDACGILFDTDGTTDQWLQGGVKAGTDTTPDYHGAAPAAATYYDLEIRVSATGGLQCFIDGVAIGPEVANAVTATVALCPIIFAANRGAAARNILVDYLYVEMNR